MSEPLAADLGRLAAPPTKRAFESLRLGMLDSLFAANADHALSPLRWEAIFTDAVEAMCAQVIADATALLRASALQSRYPRRKLATLLPGAEQSELLRNRLLAAAIPLEALATAGDDTVTRRARAAALDVAWENAVRVATGERARWQGIAMSIAAWRRKTTALWIGSAVCLLLMLVVAGWLSGVLASPAWFHPVNTAWWRLWP